MVWYEVWYESLNNATHDSELEHEKENFDVAAVVDVNTFIFNFEQTWPITLVSLLCKFFQGSIVDNIATHHQDIQTVATLVRYNSLVILLWSQWQECAKHTGYY